MTVTWKDDDAVRHFVDNRKHLPLFDCLFEAAARLVRDIGREPNHIVDLGCGSGATGGAMRMLWPGARLMLVDNSPAMLDLAREQYSQTDGVTIVDADLGQAGVMQQVTDEPADAIVSSAAIHHLPRDRQRELYGEVFEALAPGGVFVNIEHVASGSKRTERIWWRWFWEKVAASRSAAGEAVTWQDVRDEFEPRQEINILTLVDQQADWLRQIGFVDVDCVFKVYEMAVFGGYRPR
jgi:SAM-dependent methyltransferase